MSTSLLPRSEPRDEDTGPAPMTRPQILWRARYSIFGVAVIIAAATWAVSSFLPGTYSASSDVLISSRAAVASVDSVNGTNDLAHQYAQFAGTAPVLTDAAARAQVPAGELAQQTLVSTLANTNIVRVTVTAGSADAASRRAAAVATALVAQAQKLMTDRDAADPVSLEQVGTLLARSKADAARLVGTLRAAPPGSAEAAAATAALNNTQQQVLALTLKRIDLVSQAGKEADARGVTLTPLTAQPAARQIAPLPFLYSLVGLVAGLLIMAELSVLGERRRGPDSRGRRSRLGLR